MMHCLMRTIGDSQSHPFQFVFDIFALRVGKLLTYYIIIRTISFYIKWRMVLTENGSFTLLSKITYLYVFFPHYYWLPGILCPTKVYSSFERYKKTIIKKSNVSKMDIMLILNFNFAPVF